MMPKILRAYAKVREWATEYEPAVAAVLVAAFFQLLVGLGIAVGDWPAKVDSVLAFLAVLTTLLAGRSIRRRVDSPATRAARARGR